MLILGHDAAIARWVGGQLGIESFGVWYRAIGVALDDRIVGGAVFTHYNNLCDIQITFATTSPRWATRGAIRGIMAYPFVTLGCRRLTAITEAKNQPARAFLCRFGFREEGYHRDGFPTDDAVSYGLLRRECRWIEESINVDHRQAA